MGKPNKSKVSKFGKEGKGKTGYRNKGKAKATSTDERVDKYNPDKMYENHPSYWNRTGQLTNDVASFSFHQAIGARLKGFEKGYPYFTAPGVLKLNYAPCLGCITSPTHAVNVAARKLYDLINSRNSRNTAYEPNDLMIYIIAVANAWAIHSWVKRVSGLFASFNVMNRYWPDAILKSMGVTNITHIDEVKWRALANRLAIKLNTLIVPNKIAYFDREYTLPSGIYKDDPLSAKASLIYFNPVALFKYVESEDGIDGAHLKLEETPWATNGASVNPEAVESYFNTMVKDLFNSTDINMMGADILKAYGADNLYRIGEVLPSDITQAVYDPYMTMQINNARVLGSTDWIDDYVIKQNMNTNTLTASFTTTLLNNTDAAVWENIDHNCEYPLNMYADSPTVDDVVEATRFSFIIHDGRLWTGTDLLVSTSVWYFTEDASQQWRLAHLPDPHWIITDSDSVSMNELYKFRLYSKFGYAPLAYAIQRNPHAPSEVVTMQCLSDVHNYTTFSQSDLDEINECAILSVFDPAGNIPTGRK